MLTATQPVADESEAPDTLPPDPISERARQSERRRVPGPREAFATLPDGDEGFEHHDTIPAPPWHDEREEASEPTR